MIVCIQLMPVIYHEIQWEYVYLQSEYTIIQCNLNGVFYIVLWFWKCHLKCHAYDNRTISTHIIYIYIYEA